MLVHPQTQKQCTTPSRSTVLLEDQAVEEVGEDNQKNDLLQFAIEANDFLASREASYSTRFFKNYCDSLRPIPSTKPVVFAAAGAAKQQREEGPRVFYPLF